LKNEYKRSKYRKKRWTKRSQTNFEWNIIQRSLFETSLTSLVWAFTIIHFHTLSLGHDTSLIKSTQIKDWLLSFEGFNLEEKFDLLTGLFYKKGKKKKDLKSVFRDFLLNTGAVYVWLKCFQSSKINTGNQAIWLKLGCPLSIHSSWNFIFAPTVSSALSLNLDQP